MAVVKKKDIKVMRPSAVDMGKMMARKVFAKLGDHSEIHLSEDELVALLGAAFQLGFDVGTGWVP